MIDFNYETNFRLKSEISIARWIEEVITKEGYELGDVNYIFCDDSYLLDLNITYLNHDTLTDIISFDTTSGLCVNGDIFISIERVADNANFYNVTFEEELHRVLIHGILHYLGYKDKLESEQLEMTRKENESLRLLRL